jgi:hypothetical protein
MINNISESAMRVATKIDPSAVIPDKEASQRKAREIREARPIEQAEAGSRTRAETTPKNEESSHYLMNGNRVVFEKYNKDGDIVLRIPPSKTPVDEMA